MLRKTQKQFIGGTKFIGGNLSNTSGLQHILSIGYEMECNNLMKLNKSESKELVLFNSDSTLTNLDFGEGDDTNEDALLRSQELIEMEVIGDNGAPDENASFSITNDIAMYPFSKKLMRSCYYPSQDVKSSRKASRTKVASEKNHSKEKNELYIFRDTATKDEYKINYLFHTNRQCYEHSNVEWIFTYYQPKKTINVVVNTFLNMIQNLVNHTKDLTPIKGNFIFKYKDANDTVQELIIDKPVERTMYHKPDTNLYYLLNQVVEKPFTIDDVCVKTQMTFSAKAEHIFTILETLYYNKKPSITTLSDKLKNRLENIRSIKSCVDALIDEYNMTTTDHNIVLKRRKDSNVDTLKNYLFLLLYKIERYYYFKTSGAYKTKYFKDVLAVNCRHTNFTLYTELKKHVEKMMNVDGSTAAAIIKTIVLRQKHLNLMVGDMKDLLRKGVFLASNVLDKTNKNYGNPMYSLGSYFDFFENPIKDKKIASALASVSAKTSASSSVSDQELYDYDWLEYKGVDINSTRMGLKDGIVLIECRNFQEMISMFAYNIANSELKEQMKNGACNIITKHFTEDVPALTIASFKQIIEILKKKKNRKTRKNTGTKS